MQDKLKIIQKVNTFALIFLFASIFLRLFFPVFRYVTMILSCVIYIVSLIRNRILKGKFDIILVVLCSAALSWVFLREFFNAPYVNAFGLIIVYSFFTWSSKCNTGKINKSVIFYGAIAVLCTLLNGYVDNKFLFVVILLLQVYIIFKFLDPILEKIGLEHREKRLAHEAAVKKQQEENETQSGNIAVTEKETEETEV